MAVTGGAMTERESFGVDLRRAREHRGLTLNQIAEQTKVSAALFAAMERNDFSRWPSGLFRRAFLRSYAEAVGLNADDVVRRFTRLFPECNPEPPASPARTAEIVQTPAQRSAPVGGVPARGRLPKRSTAAVIDILLAVIPGAVVGLVFGFQWFWVTATCLGVTGHFLVLSLTGTTPGGRLVLGVAGGLHPARPLSRALRVQTPGRPAGPRVTTGGALHEAPAR